MIEGRKVIAVIPARGGSKSIPRKNLQNLGGRPLIEWAINTARESQEVDRVIVTTDDSEIASIATSLGAEVYWRPENLAGDQSLVVDAIRNLRDVLVSEHEEVEIFVLLEPTCPIRPTGLVSKCLRSLVESQSDSLATFSKLPLSPERIWKIENDVALPFIEGSIPWLPRQNLKVGYELNGAIYAFYPKRLPENHLGLIFGKSFAYVMPEKVIDIDTLEDLDAANALISR
jgi:CMP-N,N'-diacetyllegionaminic acid synthase